ncbi:MAG: hypothetical protein JW751_30550 [Polyangiaceae bacterium]|nr:hypothetical protein [Polyangiaceae bacterium]
MFVKALRSPLLSTEPGEVLAEALAAPGSGQFVSANAIADPVTVAGVGASAGTPQRRATGAPLLAGNQATSSAEDGDR